MSQPLMRFKPTSLELPVHYISSLGISLRLNSSFFIIFFYYSSFLSSRIFLFSSIFSRIFLFLLDVIFLVSLYFLITVFQALYKIFFSRKFPFSSTLFLLSPFLISFLPYFIFFQKFILLFHHFFCSSLLYNRRFSSYSRNFFCSYNFPLLCFLIFFSFVLLELFFLDAIFSK